MQIWILAIEHRHGVEISAHKTRASADKELLRYVEEWWDELGLLATFKDASANTHYDAIRCYFDNHDSESYVLREVELQD